ncbi:hypothetical protein FA95DRAFT_1217479 [Auriscalpium vulgare]|uniref:Uncharacterized protein n=1 Tax=Auriscalpium vulgare TaxID=40419 RepID=A0ACB8RT69_9AGAM|nr:hypothetical protein FA95DRAFT_1217479 [Auriscalpium vulgare]
MLARTSRPPSKRRLFCSALKSPSCYTGTAHLLLTKLCRSAVQCLPAFRKAVRALLCPPLSVILAPGGRSCQRISCSGSHRHDSGTTPGSVQLCSLPRLQCRMVYCPTPWIRSLDETSPY